MAPIPTLQLYSLASSIWSNVRFTHNSGAVSPGSSSIQGMLHLAWCVTLAYAGSTGVLPTCISMELMAAYLSTHPIGLELGGGGVEWGRAG